MGRIEKTVFISYRRTNTPWALAIYQDLTYHGYNVFFDYESIKSGDFEQTIIQNIRGRAHFIVILTPSALERCNEPGDWLRREIETAIDEKRNIVPLFLEGFSFSSPTIAQYLTGKMNALKKYNGLSVPADYFQAAMEKLRNDRLNTPLDAVLHPISNTVQKAVQVQQVAASKATQIKQKELTAQEWLEKGYKHIKDKNWDEAIYCSSEAIRLKPDFALAYVNRAAARVDKKDIEGGIQDCNEAIRLDPNIYNPYYIRGLAHSTKGDINKAIDDYTEAIRRNPNDSSSYVNRSQVYFTKKSWDNVIRDCNEAIRITPDYALAYYNRGGAREMKGDVEGAIKDLNVAIRLDPNYTDAYINLSKLHFNKGNWDNVILNAAKAISCDPANATAFNNRGAARLKKDDVDGAIKDFTEAIRIDPDFVLPYGGRGDAWWKKQDYQRIIADYQKYLDLGGQNVTAAKQRISEAKKKLGR